MIDTITPELVSLDQPLGGDKAAVIRALTARVAAQGRATDAEQLYTDAWAREETDETGLPGGIAIPHAKSSSVTTPSRSERSSASSAQSGAEPYFSEFTKRYSQQEL